MIEKIIFILLCGVANCARGRKLFGLTDSTTIGRIVSMLAIALGAGALTDNLYVTLWTFLSLFFWATPAWDKYWGAASGNITDMNSKSCTPIDWAMKIIWPTPTGGTRLWGLIAMGLRMTFAAPCFIGLAYLTGNLEYLWMALFTPLLSLPYFICGFPQVYRFFPAGSGIAASEFFVGLGIGLLIIFPSLSIF